MKSNIVIIILILNITFIYANNSINPIEFGAKPLKNYDNTYSLKKCFQYAVLNNKVVKFNKGHYTINGEINIDIPENCRLVIDGNGSTINSTIKKSNSEIFKFTSSSGLESKGNTLEISNFNFNGMNSNPNWTEKDFTKINIKKFIVSLDIFNVKIKHCNFSDIHGFGIITYGSVRTDYDKLNFKNVGGHFPLENDFDRYGDAIYYSQYLLEKQSISRRFSKLNITNCNIEGYNTNNNGNFASRIGICLEGYKSTGVKHNVDVLIKNCNIKYYDRAIHAEGLNANFKIENTTISYYQSYFVNVYMKGQAIWKNYSFKNRLTKNPLQERFSDYPTAKFEKDDLKFLHIYKK